MQSTSSIQLQVSALISKSGNQKNPGDRSPGFFIVYYLCELLLQILCDCSEEVLCVKPR